MLQTSKEERAQWAGLCVTWPSTFRVGHKVALNVYEGDRPIFQCHTPHEAASIVELLNAGRSLPRLLADFEELEQQLHDAEVDAAIKMNAEFVRLELRCDELERKVRELETAVRDALYAKDTSVLGNGHCIKSRARSIELWHKDPNCDVPKAAREIQELQTQTHQTLVALAHKVLPVRAAVEQK